MKIKDYLTAVGIAAGGAAVFVFFLWLLSLISWSIVWVGLVLYMLPLTYKLTKEYYESGERYFTEFLIDKVKEMTEDKPKESEIEW